MKEYRLRAMAVSLSLDHCDTSVHYYILQKHDSQRVKENVFILIHNINQQSQFWSGQWLAILTLHLLLEYYMCSPIVMKPVIIIMIMDFLIMKIKCVEFIINLAF